MNTFICHFEIAETDNYMQQTYSLKIQNVLSPADYKYHFCSLPCKNVKPVYIKDKSFIASASAWDFGNHCKLLSTGAPVLWIQDNFPPGLAADLYRKQS